MREPSGGEDEGADSSGAGAVATIARQRVEMPPSSDLPEHRSGGRPAWSLGVRRVLVDAARVAATVGGGLGLLLLAFSAFQLWGTGLLADSAQTELAAEFDVALDEAARRRADGVTAGVHDADRRAGGVTAPPAAVVASDVPPTAPPPEPGRPIARIEAAAIGLDRVVVEGVGRPQLREGPGHYPNTPLPGHAGHVAIAGHRTTHGSPFGDLDRLQPGDRIDIETVDGRFTYEVEPQRGVGGEVLGHRIVAPEDVEVLADRGDNRLTLTSCHPRYSDRQRLIVTAVLVGEPVVATRVAADLGRARSPITPGPTGRSGSGSEGTVADGGVGGSVVSDAPVRTDGAALGWQWDHAGMTAAWALVVSSILVLLALGARRLALRKGRRVAGVSAFLSGLLLTAYPLFELFTHIDSLIPAY